MSHNFVVSGKMFVKSENNEVVNILVDYFDNGASSIAIHPTAYALLRGGGILADFR